MPDRVLYRPHKDGKPEWRPTQVKSGLLSAPVPEDLFVRQKEEARVAALLTKFGLGPGGNGELWGGAEGTSDSAVE